MPKRRASIDDVRSLYASMMAAASGSEDPRLFRAFDSVPREAFLPPGPWTIIVEQKEIKTPTADPVHLYQNVLVEIDRDAGINNGEPFLHAAWIGAVAPKADDIVTHIGAGCGYYSAILSMLVLPHGHVTAFEISVRLAEAAHRNLEPFDNVDLRAEDAVSSPVPASDLIYVNAGVVAPPLSWLAALRPGGRMIFPWRPTPRIGIAGLITRTGLGFAFAPLMPSWFIPCVGASKASRRSVAPDSTRAWASRSVRLASIDEPDATATAIYDDVWFSDRLGGS